MPASSARARLAPVVGLLLGGVCGALAGAFGTVAHQSAVGAARWPVGLVLALALTGSVAEALRAAGARTGARVGAAVGWLVVVWLAAGRRPEGDLLVPGNWRGTLWLVLGFALLVGVLSWPRRVGRRPPG